MKTKQKQPAQEIQFLPTIICDIKTNDIELPYKKELCLTIEKCVQYLGKTPERFLVDSKKYDSMARALIAKHKAAGATNETKTNFLYNSVPVIPARSA